ncbi:MAG: DUF975 family protein [Anaerovorax sp.]
MENKILMTISAADQRKIGRKMMSGKWKLALVGTLVYMLAVLLPTTVLDMVFSKNIEMGTFVSMAYMILTSGAFTLGYTTFILHIFRQRDTTPGEIFSGFEQFGRALTLSLLVGIIVFAFCVPSIFLLSWGFVSLGILGSMAVSAMAVLAIVAGTALLYLPCKAAFTYAQVFFIAIDHREMAVSQVMNYSKWMMEGNKKKYFFMQVSFLGWMILANLPVTIFTVWTSSMALANVDAGLGAINPFTMNVIIFILGAGYVWLTPYMMSTGAAFYDIISGNMVIKQWDQLSQESSETSQKTNLLEELEDAESLEDSRSVDGANSPEGTKGSDR